MVVKRVTRKRLVKKTRKTQRGGGRYGFASGPQTSSFFNSTRPRSTEDFYAESRAAYAESASATIPQSYYKAEMTPLSPAEETKFWENRAAAEDAALRARQAPTAVQEISSRLKQTQINSPAQRILSKMYKNSKETAGTENHELRTVAPKLNANTAKEHFKTLKQLNNAHRQLTDIKQNNANEHASMSKGRRLLASIGSVLKPNKEQKELQRTVKQHVKTLKQAGYNVSGYSGKAAKPEKAPKIHSYA